jgi:hypothetical protein
VRSQRRRRTYPRPEVSSGIGQGSDAEDDEVTSSLVLCFLDRRYPSLQDALEYVTLMFAKILGGGPYALTGVPRLKRSIRITDPVVPRYAVIRRSSSAQPASLPAYSSTPQAYLPRGDQSLAFLALARVLTIDRSIRQATIATAPPTATTRLTSTAGCHVTWPLLIT